MLKRIWQAIANFFQRLLGKSATPEQTDRNKPPLEDTDRELVFMQLLEGVHQGWDSARVQRFFANLSDRSSEAEWIDWLQKFGDRALASPLPNHELASRLVQLGKLDRSQIGEVAADIGRQLFAKKVAANSEAQLTPEAEALFNQGNQQFQAGMFQAAIASWDRALQIKPDLYEAWTNRGLALDRLQKYEEALASYDQAVAIEPKFHTALSNKGTILTRLGRYEEALISYNQAITIQPDFFDPWLNRGNILMALQQYQEAIASYDRAIAIDIKRVEAWIAKASLLTYIRQYEPAIWTWDRALERNPNIAQGWTKRGACLYELERYEEAIASCNQALNLDGTDETAMSLISKSSVKLAALADATEQADKAGLESDSGENS